MDKLGQLRPSKKAYLSDRDFSVYLKQLEKQYPWLFQMLDTGRLTQSYVDSFVRVLRAYPGSSKIHKLEDVDKHTIKHKKQVKIGKLE